MYCAVQELFTEMTLSIVRYQDMRTQARNADERVHQGGAQERRPPLSRYFLNGLFNRAPLCQRIFQISLEHLHTHFRDYQIVSSLSHYLKIGGVESH